MQEEHFSILSEASVGRALKIIVQPDEIWLPLTYNENLRKYFKQFNFSAFARIHH